jgi:hypothetical protein
MSWPELEPGNEVERLSEIPPLMQAPCDRRQVLGSDLDMVRPFLEDRTPLVLERAATTPPTY